MNSVRKTVPIIFAILILTGTSGFQFAPITVQTAEAELPKKIIGYFPEWENADVSAINYTKLTHIIYFHIWPNADGSLDTSAVHFDDLNTIVSNAHAAEVKVMIAAGGWGVSNGFAPMAADDVARMNFVNNIVQFLDDYGLDGVDIDWEPIDTETKKNNQAILLADLKTALPDKLVTVAVNAERLDLYASSSDDVDWVNLMAYDMNWRHGEHSNFDDSVAALERYVAEGIPEEKLALGIPFYGRNDQTKAIKYEDVVATCNPSPSDNYCNGYFFNGIDLVQQKSQFILNSTYAGVMIWNLGQDTYDDTSLLDAIYEVLDVPPPPPGPPLANPDSYSVSAQNTLNIASPGVLLNDVDPDGNSTMAIIDSYTQNGKLIFNSDGSFQYTPNLDFLGIDSFSYSAYDGEFYSNVVNVTIEVNTTPSVVEETSSGFQDRKAITSVTTADSLSGVPNNLYIASISVNPNIDVKSVIGMNLDWRELKSQCGSMGGSQTEVWYAIGDEVTSDGVVTAQLASDAKSMVVSASRISGINPQSPFGSIISGNFNGENGLCSGGNVSDNYNFQIDIENQNSMLFGAIGASYEQNGYQHSPGTGFEEIFHWVTKFNDVGLSVVQKPNIPISTTSLDGTFSQLRDWHVIGIEIKPEGFGDTTNIAPSAYVGGPYSGNSGSQINFDGSDSFDPDGSIVSYEWTFGDGNIGTGMNPTHTYGISGTYNVSLKVTDNEGASNFSDTTATIISQQGSNLTVTSIVPNFMTKGEIITTSITGTGFQSGSIVTFGGAGFAPTVLNIPSVEEEKITVEITRDTRGPKKDYVYDVTVTNPDGVSVTLPMAFTVYN